MADAASEPSKKADEKWLWLSKCTAGAIAGGVTGLLAGIGLSIALGKEIDCDWLRWGVMTLVTLVAAGGGILTGGIAAGCYASES